MSQLEVADNNVTADTESTMVSNRHNGRARRGRSPCRRHTQFDGLCCSTVNDRKPPTSPLLGMEAEVGFGASSAGGVDGEVAIPS